MSIQNRTVSQTTQGIPASDGAGVRLTRLIGHDNLDYIDPFLMLDRFESDNPDDYISGFPPHPHRGFETVSYLLEGKMRHKDNQGHEGVIETGGVQWMTAGKGIIHSEMPEQRNGLLKGFQLWVNLPASQKMVPPAYQEFSADRLGKESRDGAQITLITGESSNGTQGPVKNDYIRPIFWDVKLEQGAQFEEPIDVSYSSFIVVVNGELNVEGTTVKQNQVAVLTDGNNLKITGTQDSNQFLLIAAQPLEEPIARGGPFVMNTEAEIEQAFNDYRNGQF